MPIVKDPGGLTAEVSVGSGFITLPIGDANRLLDLFAAWSAFQKQTEYVLPKRLNKATFYRARFMDAVRL